jgi:hypothetical protein
MGALGDSIDALVTLFRATFDESDVLVGDGPPPANLDHRAALHVGVAVDDSAAARSLRDFHAAGQDDPWALDCVIESWSGDTDPTAMSVRRARVFEVFDAAEAALAAMTLPASVWDLRIAGLTYRPEKTSQGTTAALTFTVEVKGYR